MSPDLDDLDAFLAAEAEALRRFLDSLPPLPSLDDLGLTLD